MNRFPLWKNLLIFCVIALGALYTLPNFFGQSPAVQISSLGTTPPVGPEVQNQVEQALKVAQLAETRASLDGVGLRVRFADTDTQLKARDIIDHVLNPEGQPQHYVVALNLVPNSPSWLSEIGALPMYLGLDLSGGVHFLLQVDQQAALTKRLEGDGAEVRSELQDKQIYYDGLSRDGERLVLHFHDGASLSSAQQVLESIHHDMNLKAEGGDLVLSLKPETRAAIQDQAVKQNILALRNRVNELGAKEPIIQQQGADRIIVQLPGVQDTAKAKDIIG
ncbi:preprotein translocase subunit SecD, partial [mine drainage metagenome]